MMRKWHFPRSILVQRFSEIDDESLLRENPAADERFEVSHGPLHLEVAEVDVA